MRIARLAVRHYDHRDGCFKRETRDDDSSELAQIWCVGAWARISVLAIVYVRMSLALVMAAMLAWPSQTKPPGDPGS